MRRHVDEAREAERRPDRRCVRWGGFAGRVAWSTWDTALALAMLREVVRRALDRVPVADPDAEVFVARTERP